MPHFFLLTLTSEACFSTPSCWLIFECFQKSNGRWDKYIYTLTGTCSILPDFSGRNISFIYSSHVLPASRTVPNPSIHYNSCPVGACSQKKPYMSHITLPKSLHAAKMSSCVRRKHKLSHGDLFDGGVLSALCLSEPPQAALARLCCLICSKACFAVGDVW